MATEKREYKGGSVATTIPAGISAGATSIVVASGGGVNFPTGGANGFFHVVVDRGLASEEKIKVTSRSADTFTVSARGADNTTAQSHGTGASLEHVLVASDIQQLNQHATDTTLNDHSQYVLKTAIFAQGAASSRPAAGNAGTLYEATDTDTNGGLFRDNGSAWERITPSPWANWTPTITVTDGGGGTSAITKTVTSATYQYRRLPGNTVEVYIQASVALNGTQAFCGLLFSSPVASARSYQLTGEAMNDVARFRVEDSGGSFGNCIAIFPYGAVSPGTTHVGQWYTDNVARTVRANGIYPI